ncbi:SAM-dependent methyltransferase [Rhodococcus sp. 14-2470-1b]|jgi:SAM-dependent methyltransferase|uniref:SAM-dependent methyltransferase n=1 Tax=unclassified Rhodococcus (in: high G+C Gram-positive bacteria) TaxID=192944 RepID=UPI000B9A703F|nr:SAM-dependent methyltransferase [Rhodococcus sp. 14-2470-1b]OZF54756.1 SAM-dependent methyltransferase [Rhodococcus sp. 14-2470-1b]
MTDGTLQKDYFDDVYDGNDDPFRLGNNWYEERKYALTLAALTEPRYRRALEPGCSVGILTEKLSSRCDDLTSTDIVASALETTRARLDARSGESDGRVQLREWSLTDSWDVFDEVGPFDLIVLSEVGYYLGPADLRAALGQAVAHLEPGGTLLAVHWRHLVADYPQTGDQVHDAIGATDGLVRMGGYVDEDVILEVFAAESSARSESAEPTGRPESVARREGLI